jgi:hypothetical protein
MWLLWRDPAWELLLALQWGLHAFFLWWRLSRLSLIQDALVFKCPQQLMLVVLQARCVMLPTFDACLKDDEGMYPADVRLGEVL